MLAENERITLLIDGVAHSNWTAYDVDSDLFTPADAWQLELGLGNGQRLPALREGSAVRLLLGDDVILSGQLDAVSETIAHKQHAIALRGRDGAAILLDSSAPIFSGRQMRLQDVINAIIKPLGIRQLRIAASKTSSKDKVQVEPGDTAWSILQQAAEAAGLWPWFEPDGTLVVGGPDYSTAPVGTLQLGGTQGNLSALSVERNLARRPSQITVLGQGAGSSARAARHALKATVKDEAISIYRPQIVVDHDVTDAAAARTRARKLLADARLEGFTASATVPGHRAPDGKPWAPGMRVHVISDPHGLDQILFCVARKMTGGAGRPSQTLLTLKEDKVWVPDAHPQSTRRRGRRARRSEEMVDVA